MPGRRRAGAGAPVHCVAAVGLWIVASQVEGGRTYPKVIALNTDCPDFPTVEQYIDPYFNVSFDRLPNGGDYTTSGFIDFKKKSSTWTQLEVNITTCPSLSDTKIRPTCRSFGRWRFENNICRLMRARNLLWTKIVDAFSPPISCSPKGLYRMDNAFVDHRLLEALQPPRNKLWHVNLLARDGQREPVFCTNFRGVILYE